MWYLFLVFKLDFNVQSLISRISGCSFHNLPLHYINECTTVFKIFKCHFHRSKLHKNVLALLYWKYVIGSLDLTDKNNWSRHLYQFIKIPKTKHKTQQTKTNKRFFSIVWIVILKPVADVLHTPSWSNWSYSNYTYWSTITAKYCVHNVTFNVRGI